MSAGLAPADRFKQACTKASSAGGARGRWLRRGVQSGAVQVFHQHIAGAAGGARYWGVPARATRWLRGERRWPGRRPCRASATRPCDPRLDKRHSCHCCPHFENGMCLVTGIPMLSLRRAMQVPAAMQLAASKTARSRQVDWQTAGGSACPRFNKSGGLPDSAMRPYSGTRMRSALLIAASRWPERENFFEVQLAELKKSYFWRCSVIREEFPCELHLFSAAAAVATCGRGFLYGLGL